MGPEQIRAYQHAKSNGITFVVIIFVTAGRPGRTASIIHARSATAFATENTCCGDICASN